MTNHPGIPYTNCMNGEMNKDHRVIKQNKLYQITLMDAADQARIDWFLKMGFETSVSQTTSGSITILTGQVIDQSHLRGFLNKLWDLNFELIQVSRLDMNRELGDQKNG